jgi:hypothetical protein
MVQECIEVFINYLNQRCDNADGFAIVDMSRVLGNLTSVCRFSRGLAFTVLTIFPYRML